MKEDNQQETLILALARLASSSVFPGGGLPGFFDKNDPDHVETGARMEYARSVLEQMGIDYFMTNLRGKVCLYDEEQDTERFYHIAAKMANMPVEQFKLIIDKTRVFEQEQTEREIS